MTSQQYNSMQCYKQLFILNACMHAMGWVSIIMMACPCSYIDLIMYYKE